MWGFAMLVWFGSGTNCSPSWWVIFCYKDLTRNHIILLILLEKLMVPRAGLEPARCFHQGIFLLTTVFTAALVILKTRL